MPKNNELSNNNNFLKKSKRMKQLAIIKRHARANICKPVLQSRRTID